MGYNFFDHKTTFFGSFLGYILQRKNVLFYLQLKGINQGYTVSFETIVKEKHTFRVIMLEIEKLLDLPD